MANLIERICKEAHDFNFFQAVSLLEAYFQSSSIAGSQADAGKIRFEPDESISFPPNDIAAIRHDENDVVTFKLSFMGLVGITSPLPIYFSEQLSKNSEVAEPLYDFLTIFNHRIYNLFYRAWKKYHFMHSFDSNGNDPFTRKVALLSGVDCSSDKTRLRLLAYCGILAGGGRSAAGLRTFLSDYFNGIPVKITEFAPRWAPLGKIIPLGKDCALGTETLLGTTYFDRAGKFKIIVGPLCRTAFEKFLPDSGNIATMKELITAYLAEPLDFDIVVQLQSIELTPVILGKNGTRLGETSSLGRSTGKTDIQSITVK